MKQVIQLWLHDPPQKLPVIQLKLFLETKIICGRFRLLVYQQPLGV